MPVGLSRFTVRFLSEHEHLTLTLGSRVLLFAKVNSTVPSCVIVARFERSSHQNTPYHFGLSLPNYRYVLLKLHLYGLELPVCSSPGVMSILIILVGCAFEII